MMGFMKNKRTFTLPTQLLRTIALGTLCALGAFTVGIETAGDVHPFARSQAALQEVLTGGAGLRGDANGNATLDADDVSIILEVANGLQTASEDQIRRGDTDGDFQLTAKDALRVLHALSRQ